MHIPRNQCSPDVGGHRTRANPPRRSRGTKRKRVIIYCSVERHVSSFPPKRGWVLLPSLEGWPKAGVGSFSHHMCDNRRLG